MESYILLSIIAFFITCGVSNLLQYQKLAASKQIKPKFLFWLVAFIFVPTGGVVAYVLMGVYKMLVNLILIYRHGNSYGGMLKSKDVPFVLDYPRHMTIPVLFLLKSDQSTEEFHKTVKSKIINTLTKRLRKHVKLRGTLKYFMGYTYILKNTVEIEDCIKELKVTANYPNTVSKNELLTLLDDYYDADMPKNNEALWEILIGKQRVVWKNSTEECELYPVVLRVAHIMSDGINLIKWIYSLFGDITISDSFDTKNVNTLKKDINYVKKFSSVALTFSNAITQCLHYFNFIPVFLVNFELFVSCSNKLGGLPLNRKAHMCLSDKMSRHYLEIAKNIKKKFPGVKLTDVFVAAFGASLTDYFEKDISTMPNYTTLGMTESPVGKVLIDLNPNKLQNDHIECANNVFMMILKLNNVSKSDIRDVALKEYLKNISSQRPQIYKSQEIEITSWVFNILLRNFPITIIKHLAHTFEVNAILTNVPGSKAITVMNGIPLKNMIIFCPTMGNVGVCLVVYTYDNELSFTLTADTKLIKDRDNAQEIVEGIYNYLDIFNNLN